MQYLLLIYQNEKRFSQGYDGAELEEYGAFVGAYPTRPIFLNLGWNP